MAQESLPLWRELESESEQTLLTTTGGIDLGKPLDEHVAALKEAGADFALIDGQEAVRRWDFVSIPEDQPVLFQSDAGFVAADKAVAAFVTGARAAGASILEGFRVRNVAQENGRLTLAGEGEVIRARAAVITAGAWAPTLLQDTGISLDARPTRETVAFFRSDFVPPSFVEWGDPAIYALCDPGRGIKAGEHIAGPTTDPDQEGEPDATSVAKIARWVQERFPAADPRPHYAETCLYTNTPDEHFVLERHDRLVVGSPCSGHGFKFAPLIGNRLADLAEEALD
jgi:sarcosine oxidase